MFTPQKTYYGVNACSFEGGNASSVFILDLMARSYVRKTARRPYSTEQLEEVLRLIQTGVLSVKRAAARYNIPRSTLRDHLKGRRGKVTGSSRGGAGRGTALSADVENLLAKSISTLAKNGFGLTKTEVQDLVAEYLKKTQKVPPTVKTGKKKIAGTGQLLTSKNAINKKRALEETTISKKKSKRLKKVSSSSSDRLDDIPEYSFESADDISDENLNPSSDDNCDVVKPGDYVLVQFPTKKTVRYYVGQIIVANITSEYRIKFLRCKNKAQGIFKWPLVDDEWDIEQDKCINKLKPPYCRRGLLCFNTDFTGYNIS